MKKILLFTAACLAAAAVAGPAQAGMRFGMAGAVKAKVNDLDDKIHAAHFRFMNGATPLGPSGAPRAKPAPSAAAKPAPLVNGSNWVLSPDKVRFRVREASIHGLYPNTQDRNSEIKFDNCEVTYDRSLNSKSVLLDCPFMMREGTYRLIEIWLDYNMDVLINDDVNNIYTDPNAPTKLTQTKPAGGGQFVTYTASPIGQPRRPGIESSSVCNRKFEVGPSNPNPVIQLVVDTTRTMRATVANGAMSFDDMGSNEPPVLVVPFVSGLASAGIYVSTGNTAFNYPSHEPVTGDKENNTLKVFYESDGQPSVIFIGSNSGWPGMTSPNWFGTHYRTQYFGIQSYMGRDSNGAVGFTAVDGTGNYTAIGSFPDLTTVGSTTTFKYKVDSNPPPPVSGPDYSSGVPSFTPDGQMDMQLIAR